MPPAKRTPNRLQRDAYTLTIRQSPEVGKALSGKDKDRKPVDPPPIVQLQIRDFNDPAQNYLQSPYYLCICSLWHAVNDDPAPEAGLMGTLVSSLHRLKDTDNSDAGFFVFPDLSVKPEGEFRLKFVLWELLEGEMESLQSVISKPFRVHLAKTFPGLAESTFLTRSFSDQGVRLRIRKETRTAQKRPITEAENPYAAAADASGMAPYGQGNPYHPGYGVDYASSMVKRQKSAGSAGYDRDTWPYSHAQPSPGLYAHPSQGPVSSYYADSATAPPPGEYGFRSAAGSDANLAAASYYPRASMSDYSQPTQALPYHHQPRSTHGDVSNGVSPYGDTSSFSNLGESPSGLSPLAPRSGDLSSAAHYRYGVTGSGASTVLPPISTGGTAVSTAVTAVLPSSPGYAYGDGRYAAGHRPGYAYGGQGKV